MIEISERSCYKDAPQELKDRLARQYVPLMHKITRQFYEKSKLEYEDILSMAEEGFVDAMNVYDPQISKMEFTKYAAYAIRNKILCGITMQENVITMNGYGIQQLKNNGQSCCITTSMDKIVSPDKEEDYNNKEFKYNLYESQGELDNPMEELVKTLNEKFSERELYLFYSFYGLNNFEMKTATQLAKELKLSIGAISQKTRKIIRFIKNDEVLMGLLKDLLE